MSGAITSFPQYVFMTWNVEVRLKERWKSPFWMTVRMSVYPEVSGMAAWRENCKWYSSLPLGASVSLFCESV
jgi:hypothetical protein